MVEDKIKKKKLEKKIEEKNIKDNTKILNEEDKKNHLIQKKLIEFLESQLKESESRILEKENQVEKEIISIYNRMGKEIENSKKFCLEKLITNFLPIADNIERALDIAKKNQSNKSYVKILDQLKLISSFLKEFFIFFHVKKIDDTKVPFDPEIHEAMSIHYTNELKSDQIVEIMQPGYILYESRLIRPAMVIVSKEKI